MGNGAKVALVGVLAMIVLVVALWDRTNEKDHEDALRSLPVLPIERPEGAKVKVRPEPAPRDTVTGEITPGPLASTAPAPRTSVPAPVPVPEPARTVVTPAAPVLASTPAPAAAPRKTYKIKQADTLSLIAEVHYGSRKHWKKIADANKETIPDPDRLPVGREIVIPPLETARVVATEAPGATTVRPSLSHTTEVSAVPAAAREPASTLYEVQPGDTLSKIAERFLGNKSKWRLIFEANRDRLPSESSLRIGQQLVIPAGR